MNTNHFKEVWEQMSDSQREIFKLGFDTGYTLAVSEAQEASGAKIPNEDAVKILEANIGLGDPDADSYFMDAIALIKGEK